MLRFQPPGFGQQVLSTSLGVMAFYTPIAPPWRSHAEDGKNLPPLVFLHSLGGGSSAYEWSKVYAAFAPDYRVIAPDLIGWGRSTHPERNYRTEDYLQVITELLERIGQPAAVVASSLTAGITVRLAILRPDLVQSLFLVSPAGYADFGADYGRNLPARLAGLPGADRLLYALGAANELAVRTFLEQVLFADRSRVTAEMVAAYLDSARQRHAEYAALASLRGDICFDLSLYIAQLKVPTAFVWGAESRFSRPSVGQRLASLNPELIRFWQIEQSGVLPHLEQPGVTIGLLRQWLSDGA